MPRGPYLDLLAALNHAGVRYAIAGGFAAVLHGVPRMTFDLDLALDLSDENLSKLVGVLRSCGYQPRLPVALDEVADRAKRQEWVEERNLVAFSLFHPQRTMEEVDLLLVGPPWDDLATTNVQRTLDGVSVTLLGRTTLRAMKLAVGREKDLVDAALLEGDDDG